MAAVQGWASLEADPGKQLLQSGRANALDLLQLLRASESAKALPRRHYFIGQMRPNTRQELEPACIGAIDGHGAIKKRKKFRRKIGYSVQPVEQRLFVDGTISGENEQRQVACGANCRDARIAHQPPSRPPAPFDRIAMHRRQAIWLAGEICG